MKNTQDSHIIQTCKLPKKVQLEAITFKRGMDKEIAHKMPKNNLGQCFELPKEPKYTCTQYPRYCGCGSCACTLRMYSLSTIRTKT